MTFKELAEALFAGKTLKHLNGTSVTMNNQGNLDFDWVDSIESPNNIAHCRSDLIDPSEDDFVILKPESVYEYKVLFEHSATGEILLSNDYYTVNEATGSFGKHLVDIIEETQRERK